MDMDIHMDMVTTKLTRPRGQSQGNWTSEQHGLCGESLSHKRRITKPPAQFWFIAWCIMPTSE